MHNVPMNRILREAFKLTYICVCFFITISFTQFPEERCLFGNGLHEYCIQGSRMGSGYIVPRKVPVRPRPHPAGTIGPVAGPVKALPSLRYHKVL